MASTVTFACSFPAPVRASSGSSRKPDPSGKKPGSSSWWAPLFGWSSSPDYINSSNESGIGTNDGIPDKESGLSGSNQEQCRHRSRFALVSSTEEKAKQLRRKTMEGCAFHDVMYHSAIASRLASDGSGQHEN